MTPLEELKIFKSELIEESIDGERITIIDKNGKDRKYKIKDYAEMCIYSNAMESQADATINIAIEVESDLVQISRHYTNCQAKSPYINCQDIEGKVFSISGNDPDFPALYFNLPVHINCKHTMTVVFKEMLERFGLENYK